MAALEHFYLDCRLPGRAAAEIVAVRATKVGDDGATNGLGFKRDTQIGDPSVVQVLADLTRGAWDVTCGVHEAGSGRFMWIHPSARVVVE